MKFSQEEIEKLRKELLVKFEKSLDVNSIGKGVSIYKVLFQLLDDFNTGCFYGDFFVRIYGDSIRKVGYFNVHTRLEHKYDIEK